MADKTIARGRYANKPLAQRLWEKVTVTEGCWPFTGCLDRHGYGQIMLGHSRKHTSAHRAAYLVAVGPIPEGMCVLHKCDNPPCVRPDHLFLGTQLENLADMARKGRNVKGDRQTTRKLETYQVLEIFKLIQEGHKDKPIGQRYGVHHRTINDIREKRTWRHLQPSGRE